MRQRRIPVRLPSCAVADEICVRSCRCVVGAALPYWQPRQDLCLPSRETQYYRLDSCHCRINCNAPFGFKITYWLYLGRSGRLCVNMEALFQFGRQ